MLIEQIVYANYEAIQ